MINLYDRVVLKNDLPKSRFTAGDVGTVVEVYNNGEGYEIEFFSLDGSTLGVETVSSDQVVPASKNMVLHIRELTA